MLFYNLLLLSFVFEVDSDSSNLTVLLQSDLPCLNLWAQLRGGAIDSGGWLLDIVFCDVNPYKETGPGFGYQGGLFAEIALQLLFVLLLIFGFNKVVYKMGFKSAFGCRSVCMTWVVCGTLLDFALEKAF